MKNIDEHIDLIERYLYDDMTQEELEEFNGLLRKDPEFNKLFYEMDHLLEGIRRSAKQTTVEEKLARLEKALPTIEVEGIKTKHKSNFVIGVYRKEYRMAIAAVISILLVSTIVFTTINNSSDPADLFDKYFMAYENLSGIERGTNDVEKLQYAMIAYDQADYQKSIEIFKQIEIIDENKIQIWLYSGNAYMMLDRIEEAIGCFKNIIEENSGFEMDAKWYLSLCYLKQGEIELAKPLLTEIKESEGSRFKEADEILSKLQ